jgi:hypothetical protein
MGLPQFGGLKGSIGLRPDATVRTQKLLLVIRDHSPDFVLRFALRNAASHCSWV